MQKTTSYGAIAPRKIDNRERLRRYSSGFALAWIAFLGAACAGPNHVAARAPVYEVMELNQGDVQKNIEALGHLPYVLHFKSGEDIAMDLRFDSKLFDLDVPQLTVHTKKDFYLLFRRGGPPLLSEDGKNFKAPRHANRFMFGFHLQKGEKPKIQAALGIRPSD